MKLQVEELIKVSDVR